MWPNRNVKEEVSPTANETEEISNMDVSSPTSIISPPVRLDEGDPQMSTGASTSLTPESIVNGEETNTFSANETNPPNDPSRDDNPQSPGQSQSLEGASRGAYTIPLPPVISRSSTRDEEYQEPFWLEEDEPDSEEEPEAFAPKVSRLYAPPATPIDLLIRKSIHTFAAVQRPTAVHQLRCECSETVAWRTSTEGPSLSELWPRRRIPRRVTDDDDEDDLSESGDDYSDEEDEEDEYGSPNYEDLDIESTLIVPFSHQRLPPPGPSPLRRQIRSIPNMPQPNLYARQVAEKFIKFVRCTRSEMEESMCCRSCGLYPIDPVSGTCGHTRCAECIEAMNRCPCGKDAPKPGFVNIVIRNMMEKAAEYRNSRVHLPKSSAKIKKGVPARVLRKAARLLTGPGITQPRRSKRVRRFQTSADEYQHNIPMSARARFAHALELLRSGNFRDAAPHLAIAGAAYDTELQAARPLLAQVVMILSKTQNRRGLNRQLNLLLRQQTSMKWVTTRDMECILCCEVMTKPVTSPCGHMFCRTCLEKTLDYRRRCPLCLRPLGNFKLNETKDTIFVDAALASIEALKKPGSMEHDLVPIFVCTVAFPSIPCPLFIFDPRYWLMIRRVLESETRTFGMIAMDREKKYADYGTLLQVHDCVQFEDGRSILSTVGQTRFKVIERCIRDGCEVARIQHVVDIKVQSLAAVQAIKTQAAKLSLKASSWLSHLSDDMRDDMTNAFGTEPNYVIELRQLDWWTTKDGPDWLWWLVAVLPLRTEIKVLILSTDSLLKRLQAVDRTLEALEYIRLAAIEPVEFQIEMQAEANSRLLN